MSKRKLPSTLPLLEAAPKWVHDKAKDSITLWHGCTSIDANDIYQNGIDLRQCREDTDFGQGFYVTSIRRQARQWAWVRFYDLPFSKRGGEFPVILEFTYPRHELGRLQSLNFVSGEYENDGYWSLVQHCRQSPGAPHHHRHENPDRADRWYEVVTGPVSAFWNQKLAVTSSDQMSFHTQHAVQPLNDQIEDARNADQAGRLIKAV